MFFDDIAAKAVANAIDRVLVSYLIFRVWTSACYMLTTLLHVTNHLMGPHIVQDLVFLLNTLLNEGQCSLRHTISGHRVKVISLSLASAMPYARIKTHDSVLNT